MANTQGDGIRENGPARNVSFESSLILPCVVIVTGRGQDKDLCNRIRIFVIGRGGFPGSLDSLLAAGKNYQSSSTSSPMIQLTGDL